jgi:hypothetical protein
VLVVTAEGGEGEPADATCPKQAPHAIGGGGSADKGGLLEVSAPIAKGKLAADGQVPTGWRVRANAGHYTSYAICAGTKPSEEPTEGEEKEAEEKEAAKVKEGATKSG